MAADPQFDIIAADEIDAIEAGRAVLAAEADATVRVHPWVPPGQIVVINRDMLPAWAKGGTDDS